MGNFHSVKTWEIWSQNNVTSVLLFLPHEKNDDEQWYEEICITVVNLKMQMGKKK